MNKVFRLTLQKYQQLNRLCQHSLDISLFFCYINTTPILVLVFFQITIDGPTPRPCDPEIFKKGQPVAALDARSNAAENWVKAVAKKARARVDWHYSGGRAQVLHLGDRESRARVYAAMREIESNLKGIILQIYTPGERGLYRKGVTQAPEGAIASSMNPFSGEAEYMVNAKDTTIVKANR